jgi:hypothetical protein
MELFTLLTKITIINLIIFIAVLWIDRFILDYKLNAYCAKSRVFNNLYYMWFMSCIFSVLGWVFVVMTYLLTYML